MSPARILVAVSVLVAATSAIANVAPGQLDRELGVPEPAEKSIETATHEVRERCSVEVIRVWRDYPKTFSTRRVRICWPGL
ncbi:hypothetical protein DLJ53_00635 [Acuticoccus sediminis]|uniref:Uncharacterized protein n=1 Tax=Acuticoccus sediminis TaxID=2184697 RepID=A0A8B2P397_9HYPH|nr:hypothetical protein [Acuticoccus sediminis]RAI03079.1 hypothetical protein DLJ53_00635 [Acuticoccus sediminis]